MDCFTKTSLALIVLSLVFIGYKAEEISSSLKVIEEQTDVPTIADAASIKEIIDPDEKKSKTKMFIERIPVVRVNGGKIYVTGGSVDADVRGYVDCY